MKYYIYVCLFAAGYGRLMRKPFNSHQKQHNDRLGR